MSSRSRLSGILRKLRGAGAPVTPLPRDPWSLILWENVVYLVDDAARKRALTRLRRDTGLRAARIAAAPDEVLLAACGEGRMAAQQVRKLRECAALFADVGDPAELVTRPAPQARKALQRFPGIGAPGVDRLLLFAGAAPLVALDSNGLRVLLRLGYGTEAKSYATSYRSAQTAAAAELPADVDVRIDAFHLLRAHGKDVCKQRPDCGACVLAAGCPGRVAG